MNKYQSQCATGLINLVRTARNREALTFALAYALGHASGLLSAGTVSLIGHERLEKLIHNAHDYRRMEFREQELPRMMMVQAA